MPVIRRLLLCRHLAALFCAAALLLKLLVPAGYMVTGVGGMPAIIVCPGVEPPPAATVMPGMHGADHDALPGHGDTKDHGKAGQAEAPCAFAGLSAAALGTIDAVLPAGLVAFAVAVSRPHARLPAPFAFAHLRPPSRGPPASY